MTLSKALAWLKSAFGRPPETKARLYPARCDTCCWWAGPDDDGLGECRLTEMNIDIAWGSGGKQAECEFPESLAHVNPWGASADGGDPGGLGGALLTAPNFVCIQWDAKEEP